MGRCISIVDLLGGGADLLVLRPVSSLPHGPATASHFGLEESSDDISDDTKGLPLFLNEREILHIIFTFIFSQDVLRLGFLPQLLHVLSEESLRHVFSSQGQG